MQISSHHSISGAISYPFIPQASSEDGAMVQKSLTEYMTCYNKKGTITTDLLPRSSLAVNNVSNHSKVHALVTQDMNPSVISQHPHRPLPLALGTWTPDLLFIRTAPMVFSPAILVWF